VVGVGEEERPYDEYWEEVLRYCESCCEGCPPSEMCPGCDCDIYCLEEEWDDLE
jgi:hypothetical protein